MEFNQLSGCMFCYLLLGKHNAIHTHCQQQCTTTCSSKGESVMMCMSCLNSLKGIKKVVQKLTKDTRSSWCYICDGKQKCFAVLKCTQQHADILGYFENDY